MHLGNFTHESNTRVVLYLPWNVHFQLYAYVRVSHEEATYLLAVQFCWGSCGQKNWLVNSIFPEINEIVSPFVTLTYSADPTVASIKKNV